jgi:hypothetical protein
MATIYQNAYLTIAATKSSHGEGGCFSIADPKHHSRDISGLGDKVLLSRVFARVQIPHYRYWTTGPYSYEDDFPLLGRAWVYQECLLSTRVLHFASNELIWDCQQQHDCEGACAPQHWVLDSSQSHSPKQDHSIALQDPSLLPQRWRRMVTQLCTLQLTFNKDRLPALSGLAKQMQQFGMGTYLAGIWESNLISDLLWYCPSETNSRYSPWQALTWSWASVNGTVSWYEAVSGNIDVDANVIHAECIPAGLDTTGEVLSGSILLHGDLFATFLSFKKTSRDGKVRQEQYAIAESQEAGAPLHQSGRFLGFFALPHLSIHPDVPLGREGQDQVFCLKIGRGQPFNAPLHRAIDTYFLILVRLEAESETYERVGLLRCNEEDILSRWQENSKRITVRIV